MMITGARDDKEQIVYSRAPYATWRPTEEVFMNLLLFKVRLNDF